jgi:ATP-dependent helicase/nuclease subunit A
VITVDLDAGVQPRSLGLTLASLGEGRLTLVLPHHPPRPDPLADEALSALARGEKHSYDALGTQALVAGRELAVARERAERQRLTYVAITRPKRALVLVGVPQPEGKRRRPNGSAFESLLNALDKPEVRGALTRIERGSALLDEALAPVGDAGLSSALTGPNPPRPARPPTRMLSIATTPLSLFQGCPRRFRLRQLMGFDEPLGTGYVELDPPDAQAKAGDGGDGGETDPTYELDPRMRGLAAHAVLELWPRENFGIPTDVAEVKRRLTLAGLRPDLPESARIADGVTRFLEGPYTREIRQQGLRMLREEPFVLTIDLSPAPDGTPRALALRGAVDLVAFRPDGTVDVVDYKLSRPRKDLAVYAFQLCAYALSMHRREPGRPIRAGVVFLAGGPGDPVFLPAEGPGGTLSPAEHERFARELAALGERFAEARWADRFDPVPLDGCRKLHCGFVGACYGPEHAG